MARMLPALPLIGGGKTRFQPVFVGDVAQAIADAVEGKARPGTIYELGGPEVKTFRECLELMLARDRPEAAARAAALAAGDRAGDRAPAICRSRCSPSTRSGSSSVDNVVSRRPMREGRTFAGLGIEPTSLAAILPTYLVPLPRRAASSSASAPPEAPCASDLGRLSSRPRTSASADARAHRRRIAGTTKTRHQPDDADDDPPPGEGREAVAADEVEEARAPRSAPRRRRRRSRWR